MDVYKTIDYWLEQLDKELNCFKTKEKKEIVRNYFYLFARNGRLFIYELKDKKGVIAYSILPDYIGEFSLNEMFMYIKPEHRGSIKLFKKLINHIEQKAKEYECKSVRIGANLRFKDEKILKALNRLGYKQDAVVKYIGD